MSSYYKRLIAIIVVVIATILVVGRSSDDMLKEGYIRIGDNSYSLEIADNRPERETGLSGRESLAHNSGMLFVFETPGVYRFWMKDTLIPLDMIWLDAGRSVIYIENDVQPGTYPQTYGPEQDSLYVIELNSGQAAEADVQVGDVIELSALLSSEGSAESV